MIILWEGLTPLQTTPDKKASPCSRAVLKGVRGASPRLDTPQQGELKRGEASLLIFFPLSLKGEGDKGGEVNK